jgi:hypothetical protein
MVYLSDSYPFDDLIEGDNVEEMLAGGATIDDLIAIGVLDDGEDKEARRKSAEESRAIFASMPELTPEDIENATPIEDVIPGW